MFTFVFNIVGGLILSMTFSFLALSSLAENNLLGAGICIPLAALMFWISIQNINYFMDWMTNDES